MGGQSPSAVPDQFGLVHTNENTFRALLDSQACQWFNLKMVTLDVWKSASANATDIFRII